MGHRTIPVVRRLSAASDGEVEVCKNYVSKIGGETMSIPVSYCAFVRAVDDPAAFRSLHPIMKRNIDCGHFSVFPCEHEPHCRELSTEEQLQLMDRFRGPPAE